MEPVKERCIVEKEAFAHGGFREVFNVMPKHDANNIVIWNEGLCDVVKKVLEETTEIMNEVNKVLLRQESEESLSRKCVYIYKCT